MNTSIYLQLISLNKTQNNHFLKRYVKLVSFYKERNWSKQFGLHEHHIIPESFGGLDTKDNLVFITIREHFILHHLLYKAFPKSTMVTAFKAMCDGWGHYSGNKVTSKVYQNVMLEFLERQRGTQNKLVAEGKHHLQNKELQKQRAKKRTLDGTNPFCGPENIKKQLENGTHTSQIKKVCPHCKREFSLNTFTRWHGDNCKFNPLFKEEIKCSKRKKIAERMSNFQDKEQVREKARERAKKRVEEGKHHLCGGEITKKQIEDGKHPWLGKNKIKKLCPHCNKEFDGGNYTKSHGDKCKLNPFYINETKLKPKIECPYCNKSFLKCHFSRSHGDKCKLKPQI